MRRRGPAPGELMYGARPVPLRLMGITVWLGFLVFPLIDAVTERGGTAHHVAVVAATLALTAGYVFMVASIWMGSAWGAEQTRLRLLAMATMLSVSCGLTLADSSNWGFLFSYCAACGSMFMADATAYGLILLSTALATLVPALAGANTGTVVGYAASSGAVGLIMSLMRDLRIRNAQLSSARSDLARLAVAEERERFARDLHDLLGHSLSVIALKAELAGRLALDHPERAAVEAADIEAVARKALGEVRDAVGGYRQPTLDGELEGARIALGAAGIACEIRWGGGTLDPAVDATLAWTVREGATNVIRHSAAERCTISVRHEPPSVTVEVLDDGAGTVASTVDGHGLEGLQQRVAALRGHVAAGPLAGGGFRLAATVPVP